MPRWRDYKARGAFLSARISRVAFGTDNRKDVAKYVIAVEVPSHAAHSEHDADPGFQEFNRLADLPQPAGLWRRGAARRLTDATAAGVDAVPANPGAAARPRTRRRHLRAKNPRPASPRRQQHHNRRTTPGETPAHASGISASACR